MIKQVFFAAFLIPMAALLALTHLSSIVDAGITDTGPSASLQSVPTVVQVNPSTAPNDIDISILITGTNFVATPTVYLGTTRLEDVNWISDTLLEAVVPWGFTPRAYSLTVENPSGESGSLANAFTVTRGIGVWNSGGPYGGDIWNIVVNPLSPSQILATAMWSGLFASEDMAEQWRPASIGAFPMRPAIDAQNPLVIYASSDGILSRSNDGGVTWQ